MTTAAGSPTNTGDFPFIHYNEQISGVTDTRLVWPTSPEPEITLTPPPMRQFETGATRNLDNSKLDYEGFLSPLVIEAYGTYMNYNRTTADGSIRDSDNWQLGIPKNAYMKSGYRHFFDWWKFHRGHSIKENIVWAICGLLFNAMGYLHELLKNDPELLEKALDQMNEERVAKKLDKPA